MKRRDFLKAAAMAGCVPGMEGISSLVHGANAPGRPLLVVVFLRGGADGLHLVGPTADSEYQTLRPPELRVADGGDRPGFVLDNSVQVDGGFRLHQDAIGLAALYRDRRLAIVHAVGLTDATRSHFVAQDLIERGIADEKRLSMVNTGWLGRVLGGTGALVAGYSATASEALALRGGNAVLAATDLGGGLNVPWGAPTVALLRGLSAVPATPVESAYHATIDMLERVDRNLMRDANGRVQAYKTDGKTTYEGAGDLVRSLTSVARLARMDAGLVAACVDFGGWDTHEGQAGRFANQVRQLSQGLSAFHDDMAAAGRGVVVVAMSEFGRRVRANRSGGTDHGHGGCWLVMGDGVLGGRMAGRWPGLTAAQMDQGLDLAVANDYRMVLGETLAFVGLNAGAAFPDYKPTGKSFGLFG